MAYYHAMSHAQDYEYTIQKSNFDIIVRPSHIPVLFLVIVQRNVFLILLQFHTHIEWIKLNKNS